ncbi:flagellar hook protein FlgE [Roseospira goensis]|uniref:Flagellar hook protein FlgE n=1 Tax=Roseospira goensis TaxID=391922 RepID=A0A7W6S0K3_9PROT|nr:flagellar hook-basal body complex protein [Roseospira goensis]MBB4286684.1 flagellar hook protein FlgE [Roseospira goensis]
MSVFAALHTSSQAMSTQSHVMERISGNVSNVNTTGYKAFDAHLRESVNHVTPKGSFVGVNAVDIRHMDRQGSVLATGRGLDLALNGPGFFVTNPAFDGSGTQHFTRNGATTGRVGEDGNSYLATVSGQYILGWAADASGAIDTESALVPIQLDSTEGLAGEPTTRIAFEANVEAGSTQGHSFEVGVWSSPGENGENARYSLVMSWTPGAIGSNTWTVGYGVRGPDGAVTPLEDTTEVTFNSDGTYATPTETPVLTVPLGEGVSNDIEIDLSGMTQYGETGFVERRQEVDGFPSGRVSNVQFDGFGRLTADYSNGQTRTLYQLAIADFPAPQNLTDVGNSMFTYDTDAGEPLFFAVENQFSRTSVQPGSLEASTVDLASEFSRMITTQRAYSTSATVYRTSDEMIRTAAALKQ